MKFKLYKIKIIFLMISIFFSVISQIQIYHDVLSIISNILWIITLILCMLNRGKIILSHFLFGYIIIGFIILGYSIIQNIFNFSWSTGPIIKVIILPIMLCLIGNTLNSEDLRKISNTYIYSSLILAIWININYFGSLSNWLSSLVYIYPQKNSAAQIFSTSIILSITNQNRKKIYNIFMIFYFLFIICLMQCRTAIISLVIVLITKMFLECRHKIKLTIALFILSFFTLSNSKIVSFISHVFLVDKYSGTSLNNFSSNRLDLYNQALNIFNKNMIFGVGNYYVDNLFLNLFVNFGVVIGIILIIFILCRIIKNTFFNSFENFFDKCLFFLSIYYFITSFFEAYPPFGPGTCSLIFWIFSSFYDTQNNKRKEVKL